MAGVDGDVHGEHASFLLKAQCHAAVKRQAAQKKISLLNSKVFAKAMAVFKQTGNYPNINIPTANTIGARRLTTSTGVSVRTFSSVYIDAARTFGTDETIRGWSTTARISF